MTAVAQSSRAPVRPARVDEAEYSLFQQLKPEVLANPYPLYRKLREHEPVHWDPFLHSWVVTTYADCVTVLSKFKAARTPTREYLDSMGLSVLGSYADLMLKQILFMDPPMHGQLRAMCAVAFSPKRIEAVRQAAEIIANDLIDRVVERGSMDLIGEFASPFPALTLAALMGLPVGDCERLKRWSSDVSELLGNFEHDPDRIQQLVASMEGLRIYLAAELTERRSEPREGVISALASAEVNGTRLSDEEIVANCVLIVSGGLEESSNVIGCGMFSLLQRPDELARLRDHPEIMPSAIEELLRFESPTQHTGRLAPENVMLGRKQIRKGQLVTAVLAAANRDPARFVDPDRLDLTRADNRHLSFGWASHYCIGAPLARLTSQIAFDVLLRRLPGLALATAKPDWRRMAALRGIVSLQVSFDSQLAARLQFGEGDRPNGG